MGLNGFFGVTFWQIFFIFYLANYIIWWYVKSQVIWMNWEKMGTPYALPITRRSEQANPVLVRLTHMWAGSSDYLLHHEWLGQTGHFLVSVEKIWIIWNVPFNISYLSIMFTQLETKVCSCPLYLLSLLFYFILTISAGRETIITEFQICILWDLTALAAFMPHK